MGHLKNLYLHAGLSLQVCSAIIEHQDIFSDRSFEWREDGVRTRRSFPIQFISLWKWILLLYIFHIRIGFGDLLYLPNLFHTSFSSFLILMMMDLFKNRFEESYMENVGMKDRNMLTGFSSYLVWYLHWRSSSAYFPFVGKELKWIISQLIFLFCSWHPKPVCYNMHIATMVKATIVLHC